MGERAKVILNEYTAKRLLMRDSLDLDKFYNSDLKLLIKAPKKIEKLELEGGKIGDKEFLAKYITHNRYKINELIDEVNKWMMF